MSDAAKELLQFFGLCTLIGIAWNLTEWVVYGTYIPSIIDTAVTILLAHFIQLNIQNKEASK